MTDIFDRILEKHKEGLAEVSQLGWTTGIKYERERIIKLLKNEREKHEKVIAFNADRKDSDMRHTICRTYQQAIQIIEDTK
jgi:hypothetical protein